MSVIERKERLSTVPSFSASLLMPKYWSIWIGLPLFYSFSWMPTKVLDWFAIKVADTVFRKNKKRTHIAKTNLSLCFPDKSGAEIVEMVYSLYRAQARAYIQYPLLWWHPRSLLEKRIDVVGLEQVEAIKARGENAIILLCHSASLDVAIAALSMRIKSSGPYKPVRNPLLDWLIANRRIRFGGIIFTREDGLRPLIKSIRNDRVLIYPADEDLGAVSKTTFAPFFGVQKATVSVLGRLAKATHSKVFTCISYYDYERSRYVVRVLPYIQALSGDDDLTDAQAMNAAIEQAVDHCPEQYLWTLRLFQTRPDGESSVY
jgi:lauroyl-KDO2-lipid IV(A) myristoyltransferase